MCILMSSVGEIVSNSLCLSVSYFPSDAQNKTVSVDALCNLWVFFLNHIFCLYSTH